MAEPDADLETALRRGLRALADAAPDPSARWVAVDERIARSHHRFLQRRRMLAGAAAAAVVAGGTWGATRRQDGDPVAIGPRDGPADSPSDQWQPIPPAPLSPRVDPDVVWADGRLLVWGGGVYGGEEHQRPPDGASWDPDSGRWAVISDAPAGAIPGGFAVWDGTELLVGPTEGDATAPWNGERPSDAWYGMAAYRPTTDSWRYVAPVEPADSNAGRGRQAVVAAGRLIVAARSVLPQTAPHDNDIMMIDPQDGLVTALPPGPLAASPYPDASGQIELVAVGPAVIAFPNWDRRPWLLDIESRTWRQLPAPPGGRSLHLEAPTAAGDVALCLDGPEIWMLDPAAPEAEMWTAGEPNPYPRPAWRYRPVWSGTELLLPGAAYDPTAQTWRALTVPPRGDDRQRQLSAVWTDDALVVFGGEEYTCADGTSCDRDRSAPDSLDGWRLPDP